MMRMSHTVWVIALVIACWVVQGLLCKPCKSTTLLPVSVWWRCGIVFFSLWLVRFNVAKWKKERYDSSPLGFCWIMNARKKSRSLSLLINAERVQTRKKGPGISVITYTRTMTYGGERVNERSIGGQMEGMKGHQMPATRLTSFDPLFFQHQQSKRFKQKCKNNVTDIILMTIDVLSTTHFWHVEW